MAVAMPRIIGRYAMALLAGAFLVAVIPWLIAGIAALPNLRALFDLIRGTGLPVRYVYPLVTQYLPNFLFAFATGFAMFKFLGGHRGKLLITVVLPWIAMTIHAYVDTCVGTEISCFGAYPFHEFAGVFDVPLGLALAAFMASPPASPQFAKPSATVVSTPGRSKAPVDVPET
jgi:hypothetical protein